MTVCNHPRNINFYDQPPRGTGKNAVHHLGIMTDNISALVAHMEAKDFNFRTPIRDFGELKYIMLEGPDRVLIEVFENSHVTEKSPVACKTTGGLIGYAKVKSYIR